VWGAWPLNGQQLLSALLHFKQADPAAYEDQLGRFGIDVWQQDPLAPIQLHVSSMAVTDPKAAWAPARRLAVLAHASRHPKLIEAQLATIVRAVLHPLFTTRLRDGRSVGQLRDPRLLAALLLASSELDEAELQRLLEVIGEDAGEPSTETVLLSMSRYLRVAGQREIARDVMRIWSSPELAPPAPAASGENP